MHSVTSPRGVVWQYDLEGSGEPLLFLHGWGVNRRIWRQQVKHFSRTFQVVAVDLPGHGGTGWCDLSLDMIAEDIYYVLDQIGLGRLNLVGSSLGGLVALKMLEQRPERVRTLVLVGSQPKFVKSEDYPYGLEPQRIQKLVVQLTEEYPAMVHIFFRSLFTKEERATRRFKWIQAFRKMDNLPDKEALIRLLHLLAFADLRRPLEECRLPVQFINGTEDYICRREVYGYLREKLPHARFDWFDSCGHFPFLIRPYEFNHTLEGFLKEHLGQE